MKTFQHQSILSGTAGLLLLLPATYFLFSLVSHLLFGATTYYGLAAGILQYGFNIEQPHAIQTILYGPLIALVINLVLLVRVRDNKKISLNFRSAWINTAVGLQALLLVILMAIYITIEYFRYLN